MMMIGFYSQASTPRRTYPHQYFGWWGHQWECPRQYSGWQCSGKWASSRQCEKKAWLSVTCWILPTFRHWCANYPVAVTLGWNCLDAGINQSLLRDVINHIVDDT